MKTTYVLGQESVLSGRSTFCETRWGTCSVETKSTGEKLPRARETGVRPEVAEAHRPQDSDLVCERG
jgi:hypothetical protein